MKDENIFLRKQLTISINELKKYSIDLNEKEQTTSDVQEENHYLTRKLEELQHTTGSHRNTVQLAQNATAAMAADAETLRYDNARLLQLADAARSRIEELEHRLRVSEGQVKSVTDQIKQMERMLTAERSERARVESTHHTTTTTSSSSSSDDDLRRLTVLLEEEKAKTYVKSFLYMLVVPLVV